MVSSIPIATNKSKEKTMTTSENGPAIQSLIDIFVAGWNSADGNALAGVSPTTPISPLLPGFADADAT